MMRIPRFGQRRRRHAACALAGGAVVVLALAVSCQHRPPPTPAASRLPDYTRSDSPVHYWSEARRHPRPLRIHGLAIDLTAADVELAAAVGADPDGDGPAEAALTPPLALAQAAGLIAAVNANAFGGLPDAEGRRSSRWHDGMPVEILGWAVADGRQHSPPEANYWSVWLDADGIGRAGNPAAAAPVRQAVAGFGSLIVEGTITPRADAVLHPRTAAGVDRTGRRLWLVVVDGRQSGYSEGMTTRELAELMAGLGCWNAVNLDGGGSSILLLARPGHGLVAMNRPSGVLHRPIPVMLGVRPRR
jgi:hypothetical protein